RAGPPRLGPRGSPRRADRRRGLPGRRHRHPPLRRSRQQHRSLDRVPARRPLRRHDRAGRLARGRPRVLRRGPQQSLRIRAPRGRMLARMSIRRDVRASDSPLVERITRVRFDSDWRGVTTPDGCWDLVVRRVSGRVELLQTGLITRPVQLAYEAGDEYLSISFKPGVFMPRLPGKRMIDRGLLRPTPSPRTFRLERDELEIPTFDNAEGLVARLIRRELIVRDEIVEGVVEGRPRAIH